MPIRTPHHLPNLRAGRRPPHPSWLPRQRRGTTPQMVGRYPDFDVLQQVSHWDEATRRLVLRRLEPPGPLRFFSAEEEPGLRAFCDTVMYQHEEPRVPVAEMVDAKLADGRLDGYRYAEMPDDRETWRRALRGLDEVAVRVHAQASFAAADVDTREAIVDLLARGLLSGGVWDSLPPKRAFSVMTRAVLAEFYSHPWAWNEIGFGGPAYPRGFMRMGEGGVLEPYERPGADAVDAARVADTL